MTNIVVSGDDISILQTLKRAGVAVNISTATKVESRLYSANSTDFMTPVTEQINTGNASWSAGVVEHLFPSSATEASRYEGQLILETQVTLGGKKTTWRSTDLSMVRGLIP